MLSIQQLRDPLTQDDGIDVVLDLMQSLGFETTGWQDGRIQKTLIILMGTFFADFTQVAKQLAEFGFNSYATGDALAEFSLSRFANTKEGAVATEGPMTLTSTAAQPYTIQVGQLISSTSDGIEFRNTTGGTLVAGSVASPSTLVLDWKARVRGAAGNAPLGAVNKLLTPLAGVTVANSSGTPWYTTAGSDDESDETLRERNSTKWARLSVELIAEAYVNVALEAGASKAVVNDQNPRGAGTIDVYVAGDSALLGTADITAIQLAFSTRAFQTSSTWPASSTSRVSVLHPTPKPLNITGTVYHEAGVSESTMQARMNAALIDFLRRTPIGGWIYYSSLSNVIALSDLLDVMKDVAGVKTVSLTTPTADIAVAPAIELVTQGSWNLTYQAVS